MIALSAISRPAGLIHHPSCPGRRRLDQGCVCLGRPSSGAQGGEEGMSLAVPATAGRGAHGVVAGAVPPPPMTEAELLAAVTANLESYMAARQRLVDGGRRAGAA